MKVSRALPHQKCGNGLISDSNLKKNIDRKRFALCQVGLSSFKLRLRCREEIIEITMFHKGGPGKQRGFGFGGFSLAAKKEESLPSNLGKGIPAARTSANVKRFQLSNHEKAEKDVSSFPLPGARKP